MKEILTAIAPFLIVITAAGLSFAVWIGRPRPPAADPFSIPFGEMPVFTQQQLREISQQGHNSSGPAIPPDAGGAGFLLSPRPGAARNFNSGGAHAGHS